MWTEEFSNPAPAGEMYEQWVVWVVCGSGQWILGSGWWAVGCGQWVGVGVGVGVGISVGVACLFFFLLFFLSADHLLLLFFRHLELLNTLTALCHIPKSDRTKPHRFIF